MVPSQEHIVIVGAGIAGLAAAWALDRRKRYRITLLDKEPWSFCHASGNNAAIYRPLEDDLAVAELAARSLPLLGELQQLSEVPLLDETGLLLLAKQEKLLQRMSDNAKTTGVRARLGDLLSLQLPGDPGLYHEGVGLWSGQGGVLNPHQIGQCLLRALDKRRTTVRLGAEVESFLRTDGGALAGVRLASGEEICAAHTLVAAGAFSGPLALAVGSQLPLVPLRRHLAVVKVDVNLPPDLPVVWNLEPEYYFRPHGADLLVSPCDETATSGLVAQTEILQLEPLSQQLGRTWGPLGAARVKRAWACVRTKALDSRPVIGPDAHVPRLHWLSGLAGFGMTCGLYAGELFARQFAHEQALDPRFLPQRLLL